MSHGDDLFAPRDNTRPDFEMRRRGYDKEQVDHHLAQLQHRMSVLATERDRALGHVKHLTTQLEQVQGQLTDLQQQPAQLDRASFRDLGPTVDQILALAERQANEITEAAAQRAADQQAEADRILTDARQEVEAARVQTEQEIHARRQALAQLQSEIDDAEQQLAQTRQQHTDVEHELADLRQHLDETSRDLAAEQDRLAKAQRSAESAERHAREVRAKVQREAERVAQLAASAVMAAAARGAETGEYPIIAPTTPGLAQVTTVAGGPAAADGDGHGDSEPATGHDLAGRHDQPEQPSELDQPDHGLAGSRDEGAGTGEPAAAAAFALPAEHPVPSYEQRYEPAYERSYDETYEQSHQHQFDGLPTGPAAGGIAPSSPAPGAGAEAAGAPAHAEPGWQDTGEIPVQRAPLPGEINAELR